MATQLRDHALSARRSISVSLPGETVALAKTLGINVSQACEAGLTAAVRREQIRRWQDENGPAIEAHNAWVETNGLPLERYRLF